MSPKSPRSQKTDDFQKESMNHLFRRLCHAHSMVFHQKFKETELLEGMGHQRIIMYLLHHEGASQADIAKQSNLARATIHKTIATMEEKGLLIKKKIDNKRDTSLYLTEKGKALRKPILAIFSEVKETLLKGFSDTEKKQLRAFFERMLDNLSHHNTT